MSEQQKNTTHKDWHSQERDRHSNKVVYGNQGGPKKGGAGGKTVWGKGGIDDLKEVVEDRNDPNYVSDEDDKKQVRIETVDVIPPVVAVLREYFSSGELEEALKSVKELQINSAEFVRKAVTLAMEKQAFERELTSQLLTSLSSTIMTSNDIETGFQRTLDVLDDIVLDSPDAVEVLSKFIARAVVDEVIPPRFLKDVQAHSNNAKEAIALASALTTEKHRIDRLAHVWGPGDLGSVKRLKEETNTLLQEYLTSGDLNEADRCVRKLNAPSFHFQIVKQALRIALERDGEEAKKIVALLAFFYKEGLVSQDHLIKGFHCVYDALNDFKLDFPNAEKQLQEISATAVTAGWLPSDWQTLQK